MDTNNLQAVDVAKRAIVDLYEEDFTKIDSSGLAGDIYDAIPANLSGNASRYVLASARQGTRAEQVVDLIPDMLNIINYFLINLKLIWGTFLKMQLLKC